MRVEQFKEGDLITRIAKTEGYGDRSYIGDKLLFLGIESGCIWYIEREGIFEHCPINKLELDEWGDDNWDYFPESKIKEWNKKYTPKQSVKK